GEAQGADAVAAGVLPGGERDAGVQPGGPLAGETAMRGGQGAPINRTQTKVVWAKPAAAAAGPGRATGPNPLPGRPDGVRERLLAGFAGHDLALGGVRYR